MNGMSNAADTCIDGERKTTKSQKVEPFTGPLDTTVVQKKGRRNVRRPFVRIIVNAAYL
jgi:hypothetical protein